jgi:hypothetical protein
MLFHHLNYDFSSNFLLPSIPFLGEAGADSACFAAKRFSSCLTSLFFCERILPLIISSFFWISYDNCWFWLNYSIVAWFSQERYIWTRFWLNFGLAIPLWGWLLYPERCTKMFSPSGPGNCLLSWWQNDYILYSFLSLTAFSTPGT